MKTILRQLFLLLLGVMPGIIIAQTAVTDTLTAPNGDKLVVTYTVERTASQVTIGLKTNVFSLAGKSQKEYRDQTKICAVFFSNIGTYTDARFNCAGIQPQAFTAPSHFELSMAGSKGYYLLSEPQTLRMTTDYKRRSEFQIPLYLINKDREKRGVSEYTLFSDFYPLRVVIPAFVENVEPSAARPAPAADEPVDPEMEALVKKIDRTIEDATKLLDRAEEVPFSGRLQKFFNDMIDYSTMDLDPQVLRRVEAFIDAYESKEADIKAASAAAAAAAASAAAAKEQARQDSIQAVAEARQDSISAALEEQKKEEEEKSMWKWIIGICAAALAFVGNQVWQHFRNKMNQKNMLQMQQQLAAKAEAEAKRQAQSFINQGLNQAENAVAGKAKDLASKAASKITINGRSKDLKI